VSHLLFGHKNRLQLDLGDLQNEKEKLSSFLQSNLNVPLTSAKNMLIVNSEKVCAYEMQRIVTKYVYRHNLNSTHWVSVEGTTVKIKRFKGNEKKKEKHKKNSLHQTPTQSWGL
jgi:hypothetical protein